MAKQKYSSAPPPQRACCTGVAAAPQGLLAHRNHRHRRTPLLSTDSHTCFSEAANIHMHFQISRGGGEGGGAWNPGPIWERTFWGQIGLDSLWPWEAWHTIGVEKRRRKAMQWCSMRGRVVGVRCMAAAAASCQLPAVQLAATAAVCSAWHSELGVQSSTSHIYRQRHTTHNKHRHEAPGWKQ